MFIKRFGTGADVYLCLHGWSGSHRTFEPLLPFLPPEASLFAADLPGFGTSPVPLRWELAAVAREIGHAFEQFSGPVTLVGNCIGALLGMRAALERPEAVGRLVLIDAFARWPWYFRVFTARGWGKHAYAFTFANPLGRWFTNRALASKRSSNSDLTQGFAAVRHDVALHYLHMLREIPSATAFAPLDIPVDIVFGEHTFGAARESAAVWRAMWPWARITELPGAGHLPLREATSALGEIIFGGGACHWQAKPTSNSTAP